MQNKTFKSLHAEMVFALRQHDEGKITDAEMDRILDYILEEHEKISQQKSSINEDALLKFNYRWSS